MSHKKEMGLIYDVGSASVACSLVEYQCADAPRVLYTTRQRVRVSEKLDHHDLLLPLCEAIDRATDDVLTNGKKQVYQRVSSSQKNPLEHVDAVFSAPWMVSKTHTITLKKAHPITITERFIENVVREEQERMRTSSTDDPVFLSDERCSIGETITEFRLDGSVAKDPYGKSAQTIEIVVYVSFVRQSIAQKIIQKTQQHFNVKEVGFHTLPFVGKAYIEAMHPQAEDYMLVEVTGESSSVSLVKNKRIQSTEYMSAGFHSMVRSIKDAFKSSFEVAYSYLKMSFEGRIDEDVNVKIGNAYAESLATWGEEFKKMLMHLEKKSLLEQTIFVVADQYGEDLFKKKIADIMKTHDTEKKYSLHVIDIPECQTCCTFSQDARTDVFVAIGACFFNRYYATDCS